MRASDSPRSLEFLKARNDALKALVYQLSRLEFPVSEIEQMRDQWLAEAFHVLEQNEKVIEKMNESEAAFNAMFGTNEPLKAVGLLGIGANIGRTITTIRNAWNIKQEAERYGVEAQNT